MASAYYRRVGWWIIAGLLFILAAQWMEGLTSNTFRLERLMGAFQWAFLGIFFLFVGHWQVRRPLRRGLTSSFSITMLLLSLSVLAFVASLILRQH